MIWIGVSGWMFLLVLAYPGTPKQWAVKWLLLFTESFSCIHSAYIKLYWKEKKSVWQNIPNHAKLLHHTHFCSQNFCKMNSPAFLDTAYGCLPFFSMSMWTWLTMSGRIGASITAGMVTIRPVAWPFSSYTLTSGLAAACTCIKPFVNMCRILQNKINPPTFSSTTVLP